MGASFLKETIKGLIPGRIMLHRLPSKHSNSILLTFDDGPEPGITEQVLDRLKQHRAKAVFFVVGKKAEQYPHLVREIYNDGHLLGLHTYNHPNNIMRSVREYRHEMEQCQTIVKRITGVESHLIRPPLGLSPACLWTSMIMKKITVMWSIEGGEWGIYKNQSADEIGRRLIRKLKRRDIVLLHDDNVKTLEVLGHVLPHLESQQLRLDSFAGV